MRKVSRGDIVDYQTYADEREAFRARVMAIKGPRRVHVGRHLTFLFENTETVRYQIQEMMRVERIVREADILHEIDTYNALIGDRGQLGCTLLIEVEDPGERDEKLRLWRDLPQHLYLRLADGRKVRPHFDAAQIGEDRLSSVQYLLFAVGEGEPAAVGSDLATLEVEQALDEKQRQALREDLRGDEI